MEVNVNSGPNVALTAVMLVLLMVVPAAAAQITVDGNGSDWDSSWFLAPDPLPDTNPGTGDVVNCGNAGYNLTGVWQHYNATEDRLYFMYNVTGIAGDSDGDYDPNNGTPSWNDGYGVGMSEEYVLMINTSPTGDPYNCPDIFLNFRNNVATATGPEAYLAGSVEAAINTTTGFFSSFVEFSVGNVTGWMANPYKYSLYGHAGSTIDFVAEDWLGEIIYVTFPPVANFTFVAGDCNQTVWFNLSGSYDDPYGGIVNYTWDFGDGTGEVRYNNSSFPHTFTFPATSGTYDVNLTVTDTDGLTGSRERTVMVNRGPVISDVTANKTSVAEPGEWVLFEGSYSDPDGDTLTHKWVISGTEIANGSSTGYSNVSYFVNDSVTATLTITDPHTCTNTSSVTVTYMRRPVPVIDFAGTGCLKVELNASESYDPDGHITNYTWDAEYGSIDDQTNVTCTANFSAGGNYTIRLNVTDNDGLTNTTTRVIYVSGKPTAVAQANRSSVATPGGWVLFNGTDSVCDTNITNSLDYTWEIHGDIHHGATAPYYVTNTTTAFLNVTDEYGCTATDNVTVTYLHRPVPVINFTATDCLEVELNASESYDPDGHITNYTWDLDGDGEYDDGIGINCTASFGAGGNYTVGLNVTDDSNLTNTTTRVIYVAHKPDAVAKANRSSVATPGGWVLFNGTDSVCDTNITNSLNHTWEIHGDIHHGMTVMYYVVNTTTANLTVRDRYNCTATDNVTVTYLHRPVPVINFTATGCLEVELNASESYDPDGHITNYTWDAGNGTIDNSTNVTCTANFSAGGNYTIRLNVTDNDGLTNSTTMEIYVVCKPTAVAKANRSFVTSPGDWVLFNGSDSTYDTNVTNSLNYTWLIHGSTYYDDGEGVLYYVTNDTTAVLTVRDRYHCNDTDTSGVTVLFLHRPVPAVINFTATGCLEVELNASESYDPDGHITNYTWDMDGDGEYDDGTGITCTVNFSEGGNHTVGLRVTDDDGLTNTTRQVIYVSCVPAADAQANRTNVASPGGWVLFNGSNSTCDPQSEPLNYTWNIQGHIYHTVTVPFHVSSTTTAVLNVTDKYGCNDTDDVTVTVHPVGEPEPVPVLTPLGMFALIAILCAVGMSRLRKG